MRVTLEIAILDFIQKLSNPILDSIMVFVSSLGNYGIIWIATSIILLFPKKTRKYGIMALVALALMQLTGNMIIKNLVERDRPYTQLEGFELLIAQPHDSSFPSGHTASAFACATVFLTGKKRWGMIALLLAILIAFSRLYLYVHYPSDILGGMVLGIVCGLISVFAYKKIKKYLDNRKKN